MSWRNFNFGNHGCPCTADCEKRCFGCRSTCEEFQKYDAERIENDKNKKYSAYSDKMGSMYYKPITASTDRIRNVNARIKQKKSRGYLV